MADVVAALDAEVDDALWVVLLLVPLIVLVEKPVREPERVVLSLADAVLESDSVDVAWASDALEAAETAFETALDAAEVAGTPVKVAEVMRVACPLTCAPTPTERSNVGEVAREFPSEESARSTNPVP